MCSLMWSIYLVAHLYLSAYMSRFVVKNGHQTDVCYKINWTICSKHITTLNLTINTIREGHIVNTSKGKKRKKVPMTREYITEANNTPHIHFLKHFAKIPITIQLRFVF